MCQEFKNPEEPDSEADELDELVDDVDEFGVPVVVQAVDDLDGSANELDGVDQMPYQDYDDEVEDEDDDEDISSDGSFDPNATDSDDSMYDTNDDETEEPDATKSNRHTKNTNGDDATGSSSVKDTQNKGSGEEATGSTVYELNEEEEDDDTVRAMIAALKKPRSTPPEIKVEDFITDICFHPERDIIALATITGDICLYEYANEGNTLLRTIEVHAKACRDIEFTDDGRNILSCSKDKSIMVTDMETEKLKKFYESAHDDAINKLYVLDENLFATGDDGGTVKLWDLRTKDAIFALKEVEDYITQIISNDAKKLLLVTSGDGYLTTFNIGARKMYVQSEPYEEELTCMGIYRGDSKLVVGTSKGRLYTYNWGQFGYHCDMYPGVKSSISEMIPITDRICCVAGEEGIIRACHIAPFRCLGVVGQHNMPVESLDICNNGELIASSSHNNDIRFWNVKYFEDFGDIKYNEKHNTHKEKQHNLPSSKLANASDFFSDLAKAPSDNEC